MFICLHCGFEFPDPKKVYDHGTGGCDYECPNCESADIEEVAECTECGAVFEDAYEYYEHDTGYHGMDCPRCGSDDIDEAKRCAECDEWVKEKNLVIGFCPACIEKHANDYETVKAYGAAKTDPVIINGLFAWAFTPAEIEELLERELMLSGRALKDAHTFATDDTEDFADWLNERSAE